MSPPNWVLSPFYRLVRWLAALLQGVNVKWQFVGAPDGRVDLRDMIVDPRDARVWYVSTMSDGLFVTRDGGATWDRHLSGNVGAMATDPGNADIVYASSDTTVYRSADRGLTWLHVYTLPDPQGFIDCILVSGNGTDLFLGSAPRCTMPASTGPATQERTGACRSTRDKEVCISGISPRTASTTCCIVARRTPLPMIRLRS